MPQQSVFLVRPRRLRVLVGLAIVGLCLLTAAGWLGLPQDVRVLFTVSQRLTLLGVVAVLVFLIASAAASYVRADADGIRLRNGLRTHVVPWSRVHKILLRKGDPWALLLLKPNDGRPFEVDLDADKRALMGIQASDGPAAQQAVDELRARHQQYLDRG